MTIPAVTIVGGGISGLACAYWLGELRPGLAVTLLERDPALGGKIRSHKMGDFTLELGPDCFVTERATMLELCRRLGLESELVAVREGKVGYLWDRDGLQKLAPSLHLGLPCHPWTALWSPSLSPLGRLGAALSNILPLPEDPAEGLGRLVNRRLESDADKKLVSPLSAGLFATGPREPTEENFPRVAVYKQEVEFSREELIYRTFRGGMQVLIDRLAEAIQVDLQTCVTVKSLREVEKGWEVTSVDGRIWPSEAVVLALPSLETARILESVDGQLAARLAGLGTVSGACVYLAFSHDHVRNPADGYGLISKDMVPRPVVACTWSTPADGDGKVVLRAFLRSSADFSVDSASPEELIEKTLECLRHPLGLSGDPLLSWVERHLQAFPEYRVGDLPQVMELENLRAWHPGLYWSGPAFGAAGIPTCVQQGRLLAETLTRS